MPPQRKPSSTLTSAEKDFLDAIERLQMGKPTHPALAELARKGTLRINFSTVAKEAGRSRTLIAHDRCPYPTIRAKVQGLMDAVHAPRDAASTIARLRTELVEMRSMLKNQQHELANACIAREKAKEEAVRWRNNHQRLERRITADRKVVRLQTVEGG